MFSGIGYPPKNPCNLCDETWRWQVRARIEGPTNLANAMHSSPPFSSLSLLLAAGIVALFLSSCASTTTRPPSPGMARFDATPDAERRDRIDGIHVSRINDRPARGSEHELAPGRTKVKVGFNWPQGGAQEVDLQFNARPNKTYVVYYDVHPPYVNRIEQAGIMDATAGEIVNAASQMDVLGALMIYPFAAAGAGAMAVRVGNEIAEDSKPANYVDVMVVAQQSSQGVVCNRRVYPDGRIEKR